MWVTWGGGFCEVCQACDSHRYISNVVICALLQNHVNPAMDFTQTPPGMLALDNMLYFAKHHQDAYIRVRTFCIADIQHWWHPFSTSLFGYIVLGEQMDLWHYKHQLIVDRQCYRATRTMFWCKLWQMLRSDPTPHIYFQSSYKYHPDRWLAGPKTSSLCFDSQEEESWCDVFQLDMGDKGKADSFVYFPSLTSYPLLAYTACLKGSSELYFVSFAYSFWHFSRECLSNFQKLF